MSAGAAGRQEGLLSLLFFRRTGDLAVRRGGGSARKRGSSWRATRAGFGEIHAQRVSPGCSLSSNQPPLDLLEHPPPEQSAAIGQNLPVAAGTVARIREALDVAVRLKRACRHP